MNDDDVRARLHGAADGIGVGPADPGALTRFLDRQRRRRRAVMVGGSVLGAVALGFGAFAVLRNDGTRVRTLAPPTTLALASTTIAATSTSLVAPAADVTTVPVGTIPVTAPPTTEAVTTVPATTSVATTSPPATVRPTTTRAPTPSTTFRVDRSVGAVGNCHTPEVEPASIVLTCADAGLYVKSLRWTSWTATGAKGTGTVVYNDCDPYCAVGHYHELPGTKVALSAPVSVSTANAGAQVIFSLITFTPDLPGFTPGPFDLPPPG